MPDITVYTKPADPYSVRMLEFLRRKSLKYREKRIHEDEPDIYQEMVDATGEMDAPQLVIDGKYVGDYERVTQLDLQGKFDDLLE